MALLIGGYAKYSHAVLMQQFTKAFQWEIWVTNAKISFSVLYLVDSLVNYLFIYFAVWKGGKYMIDLGRILELKTVNESLVLCFCSI